MTQPESHLDKLFTGGTGHGSDPGYYMTDDEDDENPCNTA